ncbi:hypothetical protein DFR58_11653 [Anaerobacterium chartisolvens]|uniref:Uncharacterized protein n=1 Tax=Anaerobacterium chartisolvens TaxID=1297424 RepID=A0A369AX01_9FIRM|nr:hypothetical protein [Anaerobacterium chartisolvens]RCX13819.1 hypothetical protein DFR58_11653 [Anaerobacterium chartisolvens]
MQTNKTKSIEKIFDELYKLSPLTKKVIKLGTHISLLLLVFGTLLILFNRSAFTYDAYFQLIAVSIIKSSLTILAEVIIGGLIIDYLFKKK